jgi:hypothetical protein
LAPTEYSYDQLHASVRTSYLPAAPRRLDDAIAETHRLLALDGIGKSVNHLEELRKSLLPVVGQAPDTLGDILSRFSGFSVTEPPARRQILTNLLSTLHEIRAGLMRKPTTSNASDDIAELAERASREASN